MFKDIEYNEVYVTRDSYDHCFDIWDCNTGIIKRDGCVEFRSTRRSSFCFDSVTLRQLRRVYKGHVPRYGNEVAWHVNIKTNVWTRIDQDMALWDAEGRKIIDV